MGYISFDVNNGRKVYFIQEGHDKDVTVKTYDGDDVESRIEIDPSDVVMLLNHYHNCKQNERPIVLDKYGDGGVSEYRLVKAEGAYSPQSYVLAVTGKCYIVDADTIEGLIEDIRGFVYLSGHELWDYPLSEIDHIVENQLNVVLVELTGEDEDGEWKTVYRWFEVPEDFGGTDLA